MASKKKRPAKASKNQEAGDPSFKQVCCKGGGQKVNDACHIDKAENDAFVAKQKKRNAKRQHHKNKKGKLSPKHPYTVRNKTWKDKHCKKLLFDYESPAHIEKKLDKALNAFETIVKEIKEKYTPETLIQRANDAIDEIPKDFKACTKMYKGDTTKLEMCIVAQRFIHTAELAVDMVGVSIEIVELSGEYDRYKTFVQKLNKEREKIKPLLAQTQKISELESKLKNAPTEAIKKEIKKEIEDEKRYSNPKKMTSTMP